MGMFDRIHTLERCGQVKCWGKTLSDFTIGSRPRLIQPLSSQESEDRLLLLRSQGLDPDLDKALRDGQPSDLRDYEVLMDWGYLVVRNGEWIAWNADRDSEVPLVDNLGRFVTDSADGSPGWAGPVSECDICTPAGDDLLEWLDDDPDW
jgi:hypothetical protein